ncbi:hypothetical protein D3C72_1480840 [compost metagenome]
MSFRAHPFARHRDQAPLIPNANVAPHFVGALAERAGLRRLGECQHVGRVGAVQEGDVGGVVAGGSRGRRRHLMQQADRLRAKAGIKRKRFRGQDGDLFAGPQKLRQRLPRLRRV